MFYVCLGGIAYVLDVDGLFPGKVNKEMVELLPLELDDDKVLLQNLLKEFIEATGYIIIWPFCTSYCLMIHNFNYNYRSSIAQYVLDNWDVESKKFVKVFPYEYQKVLKQMAATSNIVEKANGLNGTSNGNGTVVRFTIMSYFSFALL